LIGSDPRVFVIAGDQSIRTRVANLLASEQYSVENFAGGAEYMARLPHSGPACIILDTQTSGVDSAAFQRRLTEERRPEQIVFVTGRHDIRVAVDAMKRGAVDFLPKSFSDDELMSAVARAIGRSAEVVGSRARLAELTPRELEVFRWLIAGLINKEIAEEVGVKLRTIKAHRTQIIKKTGVISVVELVKLASKAGVTPARPSVSYRYNCPRPGANNSPPLANYFV
jgi:FixJ family two-component response regulator